MEDENYLRLTLEQDDDGTGEVFAEVCSRSFRGTGSAWFDSTQIEAFAVALRQFPISNESPPLLEGGYWGTAGLVERHLSLAVKPFNRAGTLIIVVDLATPSHEEELAQQVSVRFLTEYALLDRFTEGLHGLVAGSTHEALLRGIR